MKTRRLLVTAARLAAELAVAFLFLVFAAETYTHRAFSDDPRYKVVIAWFAALSGALGLLPLLFHLSPKLGRILLLAWLGVLLLFFVLGYLTKP